MANFDPGQLPPIRIPNLPTGKIVDENGMATDDELTFRQALITLLQSLMGGEGLVMPTQSPDNRDKIQDKLGPNTSNPSLPGPATCQLGTMLYVKHPSDYTQDVVQIAVRKSNDYPITPPLFKTVTLT